MLLQRSGSPLSLLAVVLNSLHGDGSRLGLFLDGHAQAVVDVLKVGRTSWVRGRLWPMR